MKISITKSGVKNVGKEMNETAEKLRIETKKLLAAFEGIEENWTGDDQAAMITIMKENYIPHLEKLSKRFEVYGKYLTEVPKLYDRVDEVYSKKKYKK